MRESASEGTGPRLAIVATPNANGPSTPTIDAIAMATAAAVRAAEQAGVSSLGLPILATGALGFPLDVAAATAVPTAIAIAIARRPLRQVLFFAKDGVDRLAIASAATADPHRQVIEYFTSPVAQPTELTGGVSKDWVDPRGFIPPAEDRLGVAAYVSMLATVISDQTTPTPLAVGVFGEWGSGKSFFMSMVRCRVVELSESGNPAYCANRSLKPRNRPPRFCKRTWTGRRRPGRPEYVT